MIPNCAVNAYRAGLLGLLLIALAGCAAPFRAPRATPQHPIATDGYFTLQSGARLPYRDWLPDRAPRAVILALHGFNDSRDAWALIAPQFTRAGIAIYAPDQRGFGAASDRGHWPGAARLVGDARDMIAALHRRYPGTRLSLMGESMGGAIALLLGAEGDRRITSYVLISPAVWGGPTLSWPLRASLVAGDTFLPWLRLTGQQAHIMASDNIKALIALSRDPLSIHATRIATLAGLVRLMGRAQRACAAFAPRHALILYGGHDQLIPKPAMARCWRRLPADPGVVTAYYPADYHLMLLDHQRRLPAADIIRFILHPDRPLRSDAATNAMIFSAQH
jgi:alpha-beta hydrolase superfamily lysophospholipase